LAACTLTTAAIAQTEPFRIEFAVPLTPAQRAMLRSDYNLRFDDYEKSAYIERLTQKRADDLTQLFPGGAVLVGSFPQPPVPPAIGGELAVRAVVWDLQAAVSLVHHLMQARATIDDPSGPVVIDPPEIIDPRTTGLRPRVIARIRAGYEGLLDDRPEIQHLERLPPRLMDGDGAAGMLQSGRTDKRPLWNRCLNGTGQIVAVLDGGHVDPEHCWFEDGNRTLGPQHRKLRSASGGMADMHATFVAGIVGGYDPNDTRDRGHAWQACLLSLGGLTYTGAPVYPELDRACKAGARIHTNSWHEHAEPRTYVYNAVDEEVDQFAWDHEDHLVIGSSGNGASTGPPGTAKNSLSVSALDIGSENKIATGVRGPVGGRQKPDLVTPGCPVRSSLQDDTDTCWVGSDQCATSWAAPAAAAAAAMMRQYFLDGWYPTGAPVPGDRMTPTGALLKALLIHSGTDMADETGFPSGGEGYGRVQLDRTLFFKDCSSADGVCGRTLWVADVRHAQGLDTASGGATYQFGVADDSEPLKVVLVWTDAPAVAGSVQPLVNDLDLTVTGGGREYRAGDQANNVELVVVDSPAKGTWELGVSPAAVNVVHPDGRGQGYALVVTGKLDRVPASAPPYFDGESFSGCNSAASAICPP
jgi:hypothetical protein